jgi:endonuclease/exonuclease/phosphatase family metal-dependent hydrolase
VNTHLTAQAQTKYDVPAQQLLQCQLILDWMKDAQMNVHNANAIIICGDFNSTRESKNYQFMVENGFRSCACEVYGAPAAVSANSDTGDIEKLEDGYCTYESKTWTFGAGIDDDVGQILIMDYIWVRGDEHFSIDECRIVGKQFQTTKHDNQQVRVYPSDHYGVFAKISF